MKKISIIIPIYNVERYIKRCIMSCLNQRISVHDYEIILVNDGTPDRSMDIVSSLIKDYSNIRIVNQKNQGLSVARNSGIDVAEGEYIWFIDSDDWIASDALKKILTIIDVDSPDVIHFRAANVCGEKVEEQNKPYIIGEKKITGKDFLCDFYNSPCAPFYVCKREMLNNYNLRFFPGIFHEDSEYSPRMLYFANSVYIMNDVFYFIYQNPTSITRSVNYKKSFDRIIVSSSLWNFCKTEVKELDVKSVFYNDIATCLNTAMNESIGMSKKQEKEFNLKLHVNKHLIKSFWYSGRMRNRVECVFFSFSSNYIGTYRLMQKMQRIYLRMEKV